MYSVLRLLTSEILYATVYGKLAVENVRNLLLK